MIWNTFTCDKVLLTWHTNIENLDLRVFLTFKFNSIKQDANWSTGLIKFEWMIRFTR